MITRVDRTHLKKSLDVIILSLLNKRALEMRSITELIYKNFRRYFSQNTIKEVLFSLEKNKLAESKTLGRKKIYTITKAGKDAVKKSSNLLKEFNL